MTRAHLVYPHGRRRAAPWSIGNHLAITLRRAGYQVIAYDWTDRVRMEVRPGDVLVGHPHEDPGYAFTDNLWQPFARRVALAPWNAGLPDYTNRLAQVQDHVDAVLPICGPYWADQAPAGWSHLDMAIHAADYPQVNRPWNPPGKRRILYVGCTLACKGPDVLLELARALRGQMDIWHVGPGLLPGCWPWGYVEMESERGRAIAAQCDFVVAPGRADANPTTVLEGVSWGLIPVMTRTSGWDLTAASSIPFIDPRNIEGAADVFRQLNGESEEWLDQEHGRVLEYLTDRGCMSFERFGARVLEALDGKHAPPR